MPERPSGQVLKAAHAEEFFTSEQCFITELANTPSDPAVSVARARVEPGITTRWHRLNGIMERYCILAGAAEVELGDRPPQAVAPGDVVLIPPGIRQRIRNTGENDLLFLAICSPRFVDSAYEEL